MNAVTTATGSSAPERVATVEVPRVGLAPRHTPEHHDQREAVGLGELAQASRRLRGAQALFFVGTAPLAGDGLVNVSPKGLRGTFGVLDDHTFAYVDMTASGIETTAHVRENGRVCVMFCSFDGTPNVVRLHGRGRVVTRGEEGFDAALEPFAMGLASRRTEARGVVTVDVMRVSDACGYAVPQMTVDGDRELLDSWTERKSHDQLRAYRDEKNEHSLDGLPGLAGLPAW